MEHTRGALGPVLRMTCGRRDEGKTGDIVSDTVLARVLKVRAKGIWEHELT